MIQLSRIHMAAACALIAHVLCHSADDGDLGMTAERQNVIIVLQQHCSLLRCLTGNGMVCSVIAGIWFFQDFCRPEDLLQNSADACVDVAF